MTPPSPSPPSLSVLIGIAAGSGIAVSGLVAAGVIVFVFGGVRQAAPPASEPVVNQHVAANSAPQEPDRPRSLGVETTAEPAPAEAVNETAAKPKPTLPEPTARPQPEPQPEKPGPLPPATVAAVDNPRPTAAADPAAGDGDPPPVAPREDPGSIEPPPPAKAAAAAAAALVAELPAAIDIVQPETLGLGAAAWSDLGACSPEAADLLEFALAQPTALWPDESGRLRLTPSDPPEQGWRIEQVEPGIDDKAARSVATVAIRDGRLTVATAASLPPAAARMLARSVLLARVRGAGDWKPVCLVRPRAVGELRLASIGDERTTLPLPLPDPFAALGLPPGSHIEVEMDEGLVTLEPTRGRPDEPFGTDIDWDKLTDGTEVVVRLRVEPRQGKERQPLLAVEAGIKGFEGKRSHERARLAKLLALGRTHKKVLAETFAGWDRAVEGMIRKPVDGLREGEVEALLNAPLPMPQRLPPVPVSLQPLGEEFAGFLARNPRGSSSDLPVSLADWQQEWRQVLRNARSDYPAYVQREWTDHFQRPLREWWVDYRPRAVAEVTEAADAVAAMAARGMHVVVRRVAVDAVGPEGERYVVPLLELNAAGNGPVDRDGLGGAGRPTGLE
jgi:hypothetical protein